MKSSPGFRRLLITGSAILFFGSCGSELNEESKKALSDLEVHPELEVTMFASEPMFTNPTNMDIDARGRVWVCEAFNYRNQYNPKNPVKAEGDRIVILEDTDGDGRADKSKVFYQGTDVNAALGIAVLGNRVIVSCSPNVLVFTDTNNDDIPDRKEIMFQGIKGQQHDHAIHAFTFGHDGKLYFNMGNEGTTLLDPKGDTVVDVTGKKILTENGPYREGLAMRCNEDGTGVEVLGHNFRNNYELVADPFGTVWQSDNDDDGNKGTRINYVMEYGNFGYKDEVTGASWHARRTNMEKEIPFRHWHLNDPGVVPNLLQTGSGSPTGILLYEGEMLPQKFRGQLIHAEPGHNVVRSYLVEKDGAGYKATIENILRSREDQWFRPADVTVGPDGSLFVADWYDPGVGGHQVGDVNKGRIYRVAAKGRGYSFQTPDFTTPEGAVAALHNPNVATRYIAFKALEAMGEKGRSALERSWSASDARRRAQAFWLLVRLPDGQRYIDAALDNRDEDIRIAALRAVRMFGKDLPKTIARLLSDESVQVKRELALSLRGLGTDSAAHAWATLANAYDGRDRWYLEALGIGAAENWDLYFDRWLKSVGSDWKAGKNRDIVWRSRAAAAVPLLAELIRTEDESAVLRYYRAFDFHQSPEKQKVLASLATGSKGAKVLYALKHMTPGTVVLTPALRAALNGALEKEKGRIEFVELASTFRLKEKSQDLLDLSIAYPDSLQGKEAMKTLLEWKETALIGKALKAADKDQVLAVIKVLAPHMHNARAIELMEGVMLDEREDLEVRKLSVKTFRGPWEAEDHLLAMARDKRIPEALHTSAAGVFQTAWRATLRDEAAKYLTLPGSREGSSLPPVSVLVGKKGNAINGKEVFRQLCQNCHQVNKEGIDFGPDLSEIGKKLPPEALYASILYPDQGISFGYEAYRIKLKDGTTAFGRIVSETEDKIDMQYMQQQKTIQKADVVSRIKLENSLMPSNLQSSMSEQELVDLVAYLADLGK